MRLNYSNFLSKDVKDDSAMPTYEGLRLKILKYPRTGKLFAENRKKQLHNTNFTIISNNCWGGMIYESYNIQKQSPTVGLFFMAKDYIEFLSDLKGYINGTLAFIKPEESRWKEMPQVVGDKRFGHYPVGALSNGKNTIEIFFLHYHSEQEAREKWERRCKRINWSKLLIKFNDQNGCTEKELKQFLALPYKNKIFFTCRNWQIDSKEIIQIRQPFNKEYIQASYEPYGKSKYIDITSVINEL